MNVRKGSLALLGLLAVLTSAVAQAAPAEWDLSYIYGAGNSSGHRVPTTELPPTTPQPGCAHTDAFLFSLELIANDTLRYLLASDTLASDVLGRWQTLAANSNSAYPGKGDVAQALLNVVGSLNGTPLFRELVRDPAASTRDNAAALGQLNALIQLPFLKVNDPDAMVNLFNQQGSMAILKKFVQKNGATAVGNTGGIGDISFHQIFHTPAKPWRDPVTHAKTGDYVSEEQVNLVLALQKLNILPVPEYVDCITGEKIALAQCCCNNSASPNYRKCIAASSGSCNTCTNFCCIGATWCPAGSC